jgi:hypothetical protein
VAFSYLDMPLLSWAIAKAPPEHLAGRAESWPKDSLGGANRVHASKTILRRFTKYRLITQNELI